MDAEAAVRAWIDGWSRAWPAGDADLLEPLYADDVVWAVVRRRDGTEATLAGVAVIRFGADGRVVEQRDYWDIADGRRPPNFR